jgi:hypothetical protein
MLLNTEVYREKYTSNLNEHQITMVNITSSTGIAFVDRRHFNRLLMEEQSTGTTVLRGQYWELVSTL